MINRSQKGLNKEALEIAWYQSQGCVTEKQMWSRFGHKDLFRLPLTEEEKKTLPEAEKKLRLKRGLFDFIAKWPREKNLTSYVQVKSHMPSAKVFDLIRRFKAAYGTTTDEFIISIVREQHWEYYGSHCACKTYKRRRTGVCKICKTKFVEDKKFIERSVKRIVVE